MFFNIKSVATHGTRKVPVDGMSVQEIEYLTATLTWPIFWKRIVSEVVCHLTWSKKRFYSNGVEVSWGSNEIIWENALETIKYHINNSTLSSFCGKSFFSSYVLVSKALAYTTSKNTFFNNCFLILAFILIMTTWSHRKLKSHMTLKLANLLKRHFLNLKIWKVISRESVWKPFISYTVSKKIKYNPINWVSRSYLM